MRRTRTIQAVIVMAFVAFALSRISSGSPASAEDTPVTTVPRNTTVPPPTAPPAMCPSSGMPAPGNDIAECPKENPYDMPMSEDGSPYQQNPIDPIKSIEVAGWGTKVVNENQSLSLQARNTEPGDLPETVQVNFDLCALKDTAISDQDSMGSGDITVDTIQFPEDGLLDGKHGEDDYSEDYSLPSVIIVDNTPMVNKVLAENSAPGDPVYGEAGDLVSVLPKGTCTTTSVEVKRADRDKLVFGFLYWTIPFGEFRVGGGVTQLSEQGPTTIRYLYENN